MAAETIDDVIRALDGIIDWAWNAKSKLGYFAALYRRVTQAVKDGIAKGQFQNGPLMERLDVNFAGRYLEAYEQFRAGQQPTLSWQIAFRAAGWWRPIVVQHLLAGINAHINLDLGVAAAVTAPGDQLTGLQPDFDQINAVLAGLVSTVEKEIATVSPLLGLLEKLSLKTDSAIIDFSLDEARKFAWDHAVKMAPMSPGEMQTAIRDLDLEAAKFGRMVVSPPWLIKVQLMPIRFFESNDVRRVLDVLAAGKAAAAVAGRGAG
jgi:Family of unknown function (DUF5995)